MYGYLDRPKKYKKDIDQYHNFPVELRENKSVNLHFHIGKIFD